MEQKNSVAVNTGFGAVRSDYLSDYSLDPWGIIIGPFIGAFIGEIIANNNSSTAMKSAFGSFIGFVLGTLLKLVACLVMGWYLVQYVYTLTTSAIG